MQKLVLASLGVAAVVAGVGAFQVFGASPYRLAVVAPANTTVWVEVRDVGDTLAAFRQSASFRDYERSATRKKVDEAWQQLLALNDTEMAAEWKKLGLPLSEESLLLGLGEFVGVGAIAAPDAPPSAFVATKLDLLGLAKKVAVDGDWSKAWESVRAALGGPAAKLESYQGYDLVSRPVQGQEVHFSLLRDVLVASIDKETVKALIEVQTGARESLGKRAAFRAEMDGLPRDHVGYAWVDLRGVREQERLVQTVTRVAERFVGAEAVKGFDGQELAVLREDLRPDVEALAFGLYLPKGEVYAAHVEASRDEEDLFRDCARHDLRELLAEETFVYLEARGLYELIRRGTESEALAALRDAQATQWLQKQLEKPEALPDSLRRQAPVPLEADPTFEARLALALTCFPLREVLGNDVALAIESHEGKTPEEMLRPLAFVRTRSLARIAADVATGVLAKQAKAAPDGPFEAKAHGARTIYALKQQPAPLYWTQVGAELAISTRRELLERVLDRAGAKAAPTDLQKAVTRLPKGYAFFAYLDMKRYQQLMKSLGGPQSAELEKLQPFMGGFGAQAWAAYVNEGCTAFTVRTWAQLGDGLDPALKKLYEAPLAVKDPQPAAWARLPEETFYSAVGQTDVDAAWDWGHRLLQAAAGEKQVADMLALVSKDYLAGEDVKATLVAPLAGDLGFGLVTQPRLGEGPDLVAVPGAVLALELDDAAAAATFGKGLEAVLAAGLKKVNAGLLAEQGDEGHARRTLLQIRAAQGLFRDADLDGDGEEDFANLFELVSAGHVDPELMGGVSRGWVFDVQAEKARFMATATRADATADSIAFAITQDGELMEVKGPIVAESFALPEGAVPFGTLPRAEAKVAEDDPRTFRLAKVQVNGAPAVRLVLPAEQGDQAQAVVGGGLAPAYAIADGWLFVATSEHALGRALAARADKGSLAASAAFRKLIAGHPTKNTLAFSHWAWSGLTPQLADNGELLARHLAPLPPELRPPARPEFPEVVQGQEQEWEKQFEKFKQDSDAYEKLMAEHQQKAAAWRKENAAANAQALVGPAGELLGLLGGVVSYTTTDADGKGIETVLELKLDPTAVTRR